MIFCFVLYGIVECEVLLHITPSSILKRTNEKCKKVNRNNKSSFVPLFGSKKREEKVRKKKKNTQKNKHKKNKQ